MAERRSLYDIGGGYQSMLRRTFLALAGSLPALDAWLREPVTVPEGALVNVQVPTKYPSKVVERRIYLVVGDQYHLVATITDPAVNSITIDGLTITGIPTTSYREDQ